jgi:hypothetical protein
VPSQLAHVAWPLLPAMVRRRLRPLALSLSGAGRTGSWIRPEFAARISLADRLSAQPSARARGGHAADEIARQLQAPLHGFVLEGGSRVYDEHGLQPADPFLDRRVVEFGLGLPPQQRTRDGLSKYVLRRAASGWLPEAVAARRTKADFGHVCVSALEALGGERFFGSLSLAARGWVDGPTTIARYGSLRQLYAAGDPSYGDMIHSLWNTAAVELAVRAAEPGGPHEERERTASAV